MTCTAGRNHHANAFLLLIGVIVGCKLSSTEAAPPGSDAAKPTDAADATIGHDASDGQMCKLAYFAPGCSGTVAGICDDGRGGACGGAVCDCQGRVRGSACDRADVPFAYFVREFDPAELFSPDAALACDPTNPDAAINH